MSIEEIIRNYYNMEPKMRKLSIEDTWEIINGYQELQNLVKEYHLLSLNRKQKSEEIHKKACLLKSLNGILEGEISTIANDYRYTDFITDYDLALKTIISLANVENEEFGIKRFFANDFASFEIQHGDREYGEVNGNIWFIANNKLLDMIDNNKPYFGSSFSKVCNEILNKHYSLIVFTDHYFENNVKPSIYNRSIECYSFRVKGMFSDISCYLYDDNLRDAVRMFAQFINENGADIKGINDDILFDNIIKKQRQSKVKIKG